MSDCFEDEWKVRSGHENTRHDFAQQKKEWLMLGRRSPKPSATETAYIEVVQRVTDGKEALNGFLPGGGNAAKCCSHASGGPILASVRQCAARTWLVSPR